MPSRAATAMWARRFEREPASGMSLQGQIRRMLVAAILDGQLPPHIALPSSRELADQLHVARNTVVLAYQQLVEEGYLISRERSGHFVNPAMLEGQREFGRERGGNGASTADTAGGVAERTATAEHAVSGERTASGKCDTHPDWARRIARPPSMQRNIVKPTNWQNYEFPFIYGQFDQDLFPTNDWRESCMKALSVMEIRNWAPDLIARDDEMLIQQIRTRVLPRRGVFAAPEDIVVTIGAQQALYLVADLLTEEGTTIGLENPGYPDARNTFLTRGARLVPLAVDAGGLNPLEDAERMAQCDYVYVTPSHQCPTTVTMPLERRHALLELAKAHDFVLIEDDYESENNFFGSSHPALKSLDDANRVIYIGSLSKTFAPGLRLGYVVGPQELVRELRALRRLMVRHPAAYIQRTFATFLALGHYDALLRRLAQAYKERSRTLAAALAAHLPEARHMPITGGASCWVEGPAWLDAVDLAEQVQTRGVLIERGDVFFMSGYERRNCFRMGYSSIKTEKIDAGVRALAELVHAKRPGS